MDTYKIRIKVGVLLVVFGSWLVVFAAYYVPGPGGEPIQCRSYGNIISQGTCNTSCGPTRNTCIGIPGTDRPCAKYEWSRYSDCSECRGLLTNNYYGNIGCIEVNYAGYVCSTADKLVNYAGVQNNGYLAAGYENCTAGNWYKVCCTDGKVGTTKEYRSPPTSDYPLPPPEGVCATGEAVITLGPFNIPSGQPHPACGGAPQPPPAPPPPPQPTNPSVSPSLCSLDVMVRVKKGNVWETNPPRNDTASSTRTDITKSSAVEIDVGLRNLNPSNKVADCYYHPCASVQKIDYCDFPPTNNTCPGGQGSPGGIDRCTNVHYDCYPNPLPDNPDFCQCNPIYGTDAYSRYTCASFADTSLTTPIYNQGLCDFNKPITRFNFYSKNPPSDLIGKLFKLNNNIRPFDVKYRDVNGYATVDFNAILQPGQVRQLQSSGEVWYSDFHNGQGALFSQPNRFGLYNLGIVTEGTMYNQPDSAVISDINGEYTTPEEAMANAKDYYQCVYTDGTTVPVGSSLVVFDESDCTNIPSSQCTLALQGKQPYNPAKDSQGIVKFYVNPTDVQPILNIAQSQDLINKNNSLIGKVVSQIRDYIVGYGINITYGVNKLDRFGYDMGNYSLFINDEPLISNEVSEPAGSQTAQYVFTPSKAGSYKFKICHNADDETFSIPIQVNNTQWEAWGNDECKEQAITVYRYLCYQGFCWECSSEPTVSGGIVNLQSGNCKSVEPIKCQTYIGSDCKAKGRE